MSSKNAPAVSRTLGAAGRWSLIVAPLALAVGWALSYRSVGDFFTFDFSAPYTDSGGKTPAAEFLATITAPDGGFRELILPHIFVYTAMPILIAAGLYLASVLFPTAPWRAAIGAALTAIGAVYFVGVLGAWLSFPAVGRARTDTGTLLPVVRELVKPQGMLLVSTMLSVLVFIGLIVLGTALYQSRIVPRWAAVLVIAGNALILAFAGTENWMTIGSLSLLAGLLPLARTRAPAA
ncbi:hypothetical protein BTM25_46730 [Actinomadura rubteroloni]|uniref:DUF4386 family protein n=1 Tax=Actinomadura rubteroloni TaxID=1926885 RepID=A0A2P4UEP9_9ACTN|nr:DUF4386 family protein [Actinomadura rubteroloni]POM23519.1 hypothetical protein BTM25_46730 [Actinomadura rubteroloni]